MKGNLLFRTSVTIFLCMAVLTVAGQSGTLPVMYIETQNHQPITSKTVYVPATYYMVDNLNPDMNIGSKDTPEQLEIRGRGNSSWRDVKKPYKIKLANKTSLLGMKKNRHWALLHFHESTVAGFQLGNIMSMEWTPSTKPVEVVLNGDYVGLYLLTETIRIGKNRLNIYEQPNWNKDGSTIPYGWLVEVDNYSETNQIYLPENDRWGIRITYHSPDSLSSVQRNWLTDEFRAINTAIYDDDKTSGDWERLIDVDAMARYFIIQEVLDNSDGFHGSFYLHKDWEDDARWVAGPLWDLNCNQRQKTDYTFRMKTSYGFIPHWIGELIKDGDFCDAVRDAWNQFYPVQVQPWMEYIDENLLHCGEALYQDNIRWNRSNSESIADRVERIKNSLIANIEWFDEHLPHATGLDHVTNLGEKSIVDVKYINLAGMSSDKPWSGVNIMLKTYNDGSVDAIKVHHLNGSF